MADRKNGFLPIAMSSLCKAVCFKQIHGDDFVPIAMN